MTTRSTSTSCCPKSTMFFRQLWQVLFLLTVTYFANAQVIAPGQIKRNAANLQYSNPLYVSPDIQKELTRSQFNGIPSSFFYEKDTRNTQRNSLSNPNLPDNVNCAGFKVIFILDESGSISGSNVTEVRNGALALANALNNSGAELRVLEFATSASVINLGGATVNNSFISNFTNYLNSSYSGQSYNPVSASPCTGWTNWEDALVKAQPLAADLIIFFTDGNPTAYNLGTSNSCGSVRTPNDNNYSASTALSRAVTAANTLKTQGKHMFAVGVGSSINENNLIQVSGLDNFSVNQNIYTDDYAIGNFNIIASTLTSAVNLICGTTLSINKTVSPTSNCVGQSVTFSINVTNTGGQYNFVANNVVIQDAVPSGFSNPQIIGNVAGASFSGNNLVFNAGNLAVNQSVSISFTAVLNTPPANYNNIATAIASNANQVSSNATVTAIYPTQPTLACYQTATFNSATCSWDVTGEQPAQPTIACYQTATFNSATCAWDVTGNQPTQPTIACYESASFNSATCAWDVTGNQPAQPTIACYESASFNTATCAWDVTGEQPAQPTIACYESASFNSATCAWDVTGDQPAQPTIACYESASFNTATCAWDVTGEQPAQPTIACYESASFNTATCAWDVTGEQPAQPTIACYESASFNTATCSWDVTGEQPTQPTIACYESASFNTATCAWDVTGEQPAQPTIACYESASFNTSTCAWDVTGEQPTQPTIACYESASFNTATCAWDVTGEQPAQPTIACYESASFNTATCAWDVTGEQPAQPTIACYESASFNTATCAWDVTGEQPAQPTIACYESASFNSATCAWDVTGEQPTQPTIACYESASFNSATCAWDVTGEQPAQPTIACYESASFNSATCAWDVTGEQPAQPTIACYESASFNSATCAWDVTGEQPAQPTIACYESASFNTATCAWDVTGEQPTQPTIACYESASFNTATCAWDVTGEQPAQPTIACYESASFNSATCAWDVTGEQPTQPTIACYESASFNTATCAWDVTGEQPAQPTIACYESASFNTATCAWDVTGEPNAPIVNEAANCNSYTWAVNGQTYTTSGQYSYFENCQDYTLNLIINSSSPLLTINETISEGESYVYNGISYTQQGTYDIAGVNEFGCPAPVRIILNVIPTPPTGCYVAEVVSYNQGSTKLNTPVNPERSLIDKVLGAPDGQNPIVNAPVQNFFSLGFGGDITMSFGEPIANGEGDDIKIWESSASPNAERAKIEVSKNGVDFFPVGEVSMTGTVDFGGVFTDYILYVKIIDISNPAQFSNVQVSDGYDVDALECLHGKYIPQGCYATTVISTIQGPTATGDPVPATRSNVEFAIGEPKAEIPGTINFYSLGFGGEITVAFDYPVANGPGDDISIGEVTWNMDCDQHPDKADVFASQDGLNYVYLGQGCHDYTFDLGPLTWAKFIKIVDASDVTKFPAVIGIDGFDVSGVECLNGAAENPGDDGLISCSAQQMISYNPGPTKINGPIAPNRNNPEKALGLPQNDQSHNFVSLGFNGSLVLRFDYVIFNQPGKDIQVIETSFGNPTCANYPEYARIAVSMDNVNYVELGEICLDGMVELGSVPYAQYVKITDISNPASARFASTETSDGYDVDAVLAVGYCFNATPRYARENAKIEIDATLQPNPAQDFTVLNLTGTIADETWNVQVMDYTGRIVMNNQFKTNDGNTQYTIDVQEYAKGVYFVVATNGDQKIVQRLVR